MKKCFFAVLCVCLLFAVSCKSKEPTTETEVIEATGESSEIVLEQPVADEVVKLTLAEMDVPAIIHDYYYGMGNYYAVNFAANYPDIDLDAFIEGFAAYKEGTELDFEVLNASVERYSDYLDAKRTEQGIANLAAAEEFLQKNALEEGVVTTESGLQYRVEKEGEGETPSEGATVHVIYTLTLLDGTEVDSSNGEEVPFSLSSVISGFSEAVRTMNPGSRITAWIHPDLGYGENAGDPVGPQSLLIFDIELVSFENPDAVAEDE